MMCQGTSTTTTGTIGIVVVLVVLSSRLALSPNDKVETAAFGSVVAAIVFRNVDKKHIRHPESKCIASTPPDSTTHPSVYSKRITPNTQQNTQPRHQQQYQQQRRLFLQSATAACTILQWMTITAATTTIADATETDSTEIDNDIIRITLTDPSMKLGLQLSNRIDESSSSPTTGDFTRKTSTMVYVQRIVSPSSTNANIKEGMILLQYNNAKTVQDTLLQKQSYPITLFFQTPPPNPTTILNPPPTSSSTNTNSDSTYQIVKISPTCTSIDTNDNSNENTTPPQQQPQEPQQSSRRRSSQRGDVLGIIYEAHVDSPTGRIYDASYQRGTGGPYQMVLGSGDMIIGVDQGLYDMCLQEVRGIYIPSRLAYSTRGNRMFQIPPNTNLYWQVKLVRID
jgi:FKBP-type peptidyl-prolyl cis-trans isomerase